MKKLIDKISNLIKERQQLELKNEMLRLNDLVTGIESIPTFSDIKSRISDAKADLFIEILNQINNNYLDYNQDEESGKRVEQQIEKLYNESSNFGSARKRVYSVIAQSAFCPDWLLKKLFDCNCMNEVLSNPRFSYLLLANPLSLIEYIQSTGFDSSSMVPYQVWDCLINQQALKDKRKRICQYNYDIIPEQIKLELAIADDACRQLLIKNGWECPPSLLEERKIECFSTFYVDIDDNHIHSVIPNAYVESDIIYQNVNANPDKLSVPYIKRIQAPAVRFDTIFHNNYTFTFPLLEGVYYDDFDEVDEGEIWFHVKQIGNRWVCGIGTTQKNAQFELLNSPVSILPMNDTWTLSACVKHQYVTEDIPACSGLYKKMVAAQQEF